MRHRLLLFCLLSYVLSFLVTHARSINSDKSMKSNSHLDSISYPSDIKHMTIDELEQLSAEIRDEVLNTVIKTGGHLSSSLGVSDLTVALHYVFDMPNDRIIWDVGHQAYPHKILTGRRDRMHTIRSRGGLSGFTKREESVYDPFGAGHSSTSISAIHGMFEGRQIMDPNGPLPNCIAVIGDGAITGGMAFEALNSAGDLNSRIIVILNDNGEVSLPTGMETKAGTSPASALSSFLSNKNISQTGSGFFNAFNSAYVGPVDGHNMRELVNVLAGIKDGSISPQNRPIVVHLKTIKGYGYDPAILASDKMHGVTAGFDRSSGKPKPSSKSGSQPQTFTKIFAQELIRMAKEDKSVVAITAAMPGGTGVGDFGKIFPERSYDVGIAEQHAVTMGAGMAVEGVKPFVAIYSTFLQRGLDQIIHDVALQALPVRFVIDRAGFVGQDGATHHGLFDMSFLASMPGMGVIMAPSDQIELRRMVQLMKYLDSAPSAVRYPRGNGYLDADLIEHCGHNAELVSFLSNNTEADVGVATVGKARVVRNVLKSVCKVKLGVLSLGSRLKDVSLALRGIEKSINGVCYSLVDARFMQPLDIQMINELSSEADLIITVEEAINTGGFGYHVLQHLMEETDIFFGKKKMFKSLGITKNLVFEAATPEHQLEDAGLDVNGLQKSFTHFIEQFLKF